MNNKIEPSSSMQALHIRQWCAEGTVADTMAFGRIPSPKAPVKNEVLIGIKASSINIDDLLACQDTGGGGWCFHARTPSSKSPLVGGCEYAGVVLACGPSCKKLKVGDRVCGLQDFVGKKLAGTWAEQTLTPETHCVPIPADLSFLEAASLCMGALVSGNMYKLAKLGQGARCLVLGASGGLGSIMLQLLRSHKASPHITAVCSAANFELVRRLGAGEAVDYRKSPFGKQLQGQEFDVVFDFVGGKDTEKSSAALLKPGGQFITAVGPMQNIGSRKLSCCEWTGWACGLAKRMMCGCCRKYQYKFSYAMMPVKEEDFNLVAVEAGARAEIALEVPFAEEAVREAMKRVISRHTGGRDKHAIT
jgi:NADPH:quinone reductase-like Zn-dependent oxidoreductase